MTTRRGWRSAALAAGVALLATSCAEDAPYDTLEPEGDAADKIAGLYWVYWVAVAVAVIVLVATVFVVVRFRRRHEDEVPTQIHGNSKLEITWTLLPALILAGVAVPTVGTIFDLSEQPESGALEINVTGQQWWWEFTYPQQGIVTATEIVFPAGVDVKLNITSRDVIHSFWIPRLNGKRDAVPNRVHTQTIHADEPGIYEGQCVEFCGLSHANMRLIGRALSQDQFDEWVEQQQQDAVEPADEESAEGRGFATFTGLCAQCHVVNGVNDETQGAVPLVAGKAPNLTHFMSRAKYAGALFDLYEDYEEGTYQEINRAQLEAWLRDAPAEKPMAPDDERGMPNLGLAEGQIDDLVAYLMTLGDPPINPDGDGGIREPQP